MNSQEIKCDFYLEKLQHGFYRLLDMFGQSCKKATDMRVLPVRKVCKVGSE